MSKKLIAVASAAALALSALVGIAPANSAVAPFSVDTNGAITETTARDGSTATKAFQINVPTSDVLRWVETTATPSTWNSTQATAVKFVVTTPAANDTVTVTSTGAVELLTATQFADATTTTATGTQSLTLTNTAAELAFYAYTTSTTAGTVVVSSGGNSSTTHLTGVSLMPYKVNLTAPATVGLGGNIVMSGRIVDAFGNDLTTGLVYGDFVFSQVGPAAAPANSAAGFSYNSTTKVYTITWIAPSTAQGVAVQATLAAGKSPTAVTAFGATAPTAFSSVSVVDAAAQVASLNAQVAALTAQLAATVTKAKYNKLARKWNRANPNNRVKLAR